jgi:hypothetical protein
MMTSNEKEESNMAENNAKDPAAEIQFHVSPDLEYIYRDVFNVYVGAGDVLIEFGNQHRSMPEHATISNRIVMTVANAYALIQTLQKAMQDAQIKLHEQLQMQKKTGSSD